MTVLQSHPGLRRALVVIEQLACAAAVYTVAGLIWRGLSAEHNRPGVVTVLAATVVVAVVLALSRRGFERSVNWLAFGKRADGYELASGFLRRLATSIELDEVLPRLAETAARTVGSRRGEVSVWLADGSSWRQTWPVDADERVADVTVPVHHAGDRVGEMAVAMEAGDLTTADRRLLDQLAGPAGLALSTVRLTHALRQQLAEIDGTATQIRASRERLIGARRSEQVLIRRQLDDHVKPHLDAAWSALGDPALGDVEPDLPAATVHVSQALEELRSLARGVFPAQLTDAGLLESLRGWAEQHRRRVSFSVSGDPDRLRQQADVAAALYFCSVTALASTGGEPRLAIDVGQTESTAEFPLTRGTARLRTSIWPR